MNDESLNNLVESIFGAMSAYHAELRAILTEELTDLCEAVYELTKDGFYDNKPEPFRRHVENRVHRIMSRLGAAEEKRSSS